VELTSYSTLRAGSEAGTVTLTLARPGQANAIDGMVLAELRRALDEAAADPGCRVVVIRGAPGVFCAGLDFEDALGTGNPDDPGGEAFFDLLRGLTLLPRVVIALVEGQAAGGGVGLAAACDLVVASPASTFALPEALWGLLPCSVLPFLVRRVGFQKAYAMTLTTMPVGAIEAAACGLADVVADDPAAVARRLAYRIGKVSPETVADAKRYVGACAPVSDGDRHRAVAEFSRLVGTPRVRRNLAEYVEHHRMPWEH
jgi:polyketide biosynthesis enoyl-CoA hydratase PksH